MGRPRKIAPISVKPLSLQRFVRIIQIPPKAEFQFPGYQAEMILVDGEQVVERKLIDKPNLFEYAFYQAAELVDPRLKDKE